jgi:hypothetical protein
VLREIEKRSDKELEEQTGVVALLNTVLTDALHTGENITNIADFIAELRGAIGKTGDPVVREVGKRRAAAMGKILADRIVKSKSESV